MAACSFCLFAQELCSESGDVVWKNTLPNHGFRENIHNDKLYCDLRYQGQIEDRESGLYYNVNRYYDADSGQYLSPDPIGFVGGLRPQAYVFNPLDWVDPLGLAGEAHEGTGQDVAKATDLPVVKPGAPEWKNAVDRMSGLGKGKLNVRTETATDAQVLLKEGRGNMNRHKNYTNDTYNKGYEVHNVQNLRELGAGNDLKHLKWKDGKSGGHVYYDKPN